MAHLVIMAPIWNGGDRLVGLAEWRLKQEDPITTFEITYTNIKGKRIFPHPFRVATSKVLAGKQQYVGVKVRLVRLADCEEVTA